MTFENSFRMEALNTTYTTVSELCALAHSMCILMVTKFEKAITKHFDQDNLKDNFVKTYIAYREDSSDYFYRFYDPLTINMYCDKEKCKEMVFYIDFSTQRMGLQMFNDHAFDASSPDSLHKDTVNDIKMNVIASTNPLELLDQTYLNDILNIESLDSKQAQLSLLKQKDSIIHTYNEHFYNQLNEFLEAGTNLYDIYQTLTSDSEPKNFRLYNTPSGLEIKIRKERFGDPQDEENSPQ